MGVRRTWVRVAEAEAVVPPGMRADVEHCAQHGANRRENEQPPDTRQGLTVDQLRKEARELLANRAGFIRIELSDKVSAAVRRPVRYLHLRGGGCAAEQHSHEKAETPTLHRDHRTVGSHLRDSLPVHMPLPPLLKARQRPWPLYSRTFFLPAHAIMIIDHWQRGLASCTAAAGACASYL